MKFCPVCKTRYDEEILRFCTKDGAPLVEETTPNFTGSPNFAAGDDLGEETVIRRKLPTNQTIPAALPEDFDEEPASQISRNSAERIIIPTAEEERREQQQVRTKTVAYQPKPPSNTGKIVVLTILGTVAVLLGAGGLFWFLRSQTPTANSNLNVNTNPYNINANSNGNSNIDSTFNFNAAVNANSNANANLNTNFNLNGNANKTPTPTPKSSPSPTPKPSESPSENNTNSVTNTNSANSATPRPPASPTPTRAAPSPSATPSAPPVNRPVNAGLLNGQAVNLPKPAYPAAARAMHANGQVTVQVTLDENGGVMSAKALSGNPLLRQSAEAAARQSRFNPIRVAGQAVPATGILVYNFIN